ncbi:MAG: hypothetical protein J7M01_03715 [Candidatus Marinimicrobia bacterium]|nr:hypothetical protein [Candidatus Neomarinimicrobiota bacterium]
MSKSSRIRIIATCIIIFSVSVLLIVKHKLPSESDTFVKERLEDMEIYVVSDGLYHYACKEDDWIKVFSDTMALHYQDTFVGKDCLVYKDLTDYSIKLIHLASGKKKVLLADNAFGPLSLSRSQKKLAYSTYLNERLQIAYLLLDDNSCTITELSGHDGLLWSFDGDVIYYSEGGRIFEYDTLTQESIYITDGYWPQSINNHTLYYWKNDANLSVLLRYDLDRRIETECFAIKNYMLGYSIDPRGEYVICMIPSVKGVCVPIIYDIDGNKKMSLKATPTKTGNVFWIQ